MDCQVDKILHFQHFLLIAHNQSQKASKASGDIFAMYREDTIAEKTAWDWFGKFKHDNFNL